MVWRTALIGATYLAYCVVQAGHYEVSYSGGGTVIVGPSGQPWSRNYALGQDGFYGDSAVSQNPGGGIAGNGSVTCSGQVTATFTWVPSHPYDSPPEVAILREEGVATWAGDSGNCANGVTSHYSGSQYSGTSMGLDYIVWENPGASFSIYRIPHAQAALGPGSPSGEIAAEASALYRAELTPVTLTVLGTVRVGSELHALIGQGMTAMLDAPGYTVSNFDWSIGGETFHHVEQYSYRRIFELTTQNLAEESPDWYYDAPIDNAKVACEATIWRDQTPLGSVSVSAQVEVRRPTTSLTNETGSVFFLPDNVGPDSIATSDIEEGSIGSEFHLTMSVPTVFAVNGSVGQMGYAQTCNLDYLQTGGAFYQTLQTLGWELDNSWLYAGPAPADPDDDDPLPLYAEDSPEWWLKPWCEYVTVDGEFRMFGVFRPTPLPGTIGAEWVSVKVARWSWIAWGEEGSGGAPWTGPVGNVYNIGVLDNQNFWLQWERIHLNN